MLQPIRSYFLPKSMHLKFHIPEENFTAELELLLPKSMLQRFHILELKFKAKLELLLPKSML